MIIPRRLAGGRLIPTRLIPRSDPPAEQTSFAIYIRREPGVAYMNPIFSVGDRLRNMGWMSPQKHADLWVKVLNYVTGTDFDTYSVQMLRGPANLAIPKGSMWVSYGQPGDGLIFITATGLEDPEAAPYMDVFISGPEDEPWAVTHHVRVGKLQNILGLDGTHWGLAGGRDLKDPDEPHTIIGTINKTHRVLQVWTDKDNNVVGGVDPEAGTGEKAWWVGSDRDPSIWVLGGDSPQVGIKQSVIFGSEAKAAFSTFGGVFLLGPTGEISSSKWVTSGGEECSITGAFRQVVSMFPGHRAMEFIDGTKNLCTDPIHGIGVSWWGTASGCSISHSSSRSLDGTHSAMVTSSAAQNYASKDLDLSPTQGDTWGARIWVMADNPSAYGRDIKLQIRESGGASDDEYSESPTVKLSGRWQSLGIARSVSRSDRTLVQLRVVSWVPSGAHYYIDGITVQSSASSEVYGPPQNVWGGLPGCTWDGNDHASASTAVKTSLRADDSAYLLSDRKQMSVLIRMRMMFNASDRLFGRHMFVFDAVGANQYANEQRYMVVFHSGQWFVYAGNFGRVISFDVTGSGHEFKYGDVVRLLITHDWPAGSHKLYLDGSVVAETTRMALPDGLNVDDWYIGTDKTVGTGSYQRGTGGFALDELSVYNRVLAPEAVTILYRSTSPLVDIGSMDTPGIYVWDGRAVFASSETGKRSEVSAGGVKVYESDNSLGTEISEDGIILHVSGTESEAEQRSITVHSDTLDQTIGYLQGYESPSLHEILISLTGDGRDGRITLDAYADDVGDVARVVMNATRGIKSVLAGAEADDDLGKFFVSGGPIQVEEIVAPPTPDTDEAYIYLDTGGDLNVVFDNGTTRELASKT